MCTLIFPSKVWANTCALYTAKYSTGSLNLRTYTESGNPEINGRKEVKSLAAGSTFSYPKNTS